MAKFSGPKVRFCASNLITRGKCPCRTYTGYAEDQAFMKYYILAGEASGDLHGANLIRALREEDPEADVRAWGGDCMSRAGAVVVKHYRELAFMGFLEVVKDLPAILGNFKACKSDILRFGPDVLVLIDYPGFNLRMARWAKAQNIKVFYYISPQLWAWHTSRVNIVRQAVDRMFVILPFEKEFYETHGVEVDYVGHPLLDVVDEPVAEANFFQRFDLPEKKPVIALLPGSRRQEIAGMLPVMAEVVHHFPDYHFVVAGAPSIEPAFYRDILPAGKEIHIVHNETYAVLRQAKAALVTSGTATLETALFDVPQVVCYRGNAFSFWLAKRLVGKRVKYISLVNLIAGKAVVQELLQDKFSAKNLHIALSNLLKGPEREQILQDYAEIRVKLGTAGASRRTAALMVKYLKNR